MPAQAWVLAPSTHHSVSAARHEARHEQGTCGERGVEGAGGVRRCTRASYRDEWEDELRVAAAEETALGEIAVDEKLGQHGDAGAGAHELHLRRDAVRRRADARSRPSRA